MNKELIESILENPPSVASFDFDDTLSFGIYSDRKSFNSYNIKGRRLSPIIKNIVSRLYDLGTTLYMVTSRQDCPQNRIEVSEFLTKNNIIHCFKELIFVGAGKAHKLQEIGSDLHFDDNSKEFIFSKDNYPDAKTDFIHIDHTIAPGEEDDGSWKLSRYSMANKKLNELYSFLKSNNFKREASLLKGLLVKTAITFGEFDKEFEGYLYYRSKSGSSKVMLDDMSGQKELINLLKRDSSAKAYIIYTSRGTPISQSDVELRGDQMYIRPSDLVDREDGLLQSIYNNPNFWAKDSEVLEDNLYKITFPSVYFEEYGRSYEHIHNRLYVKLAEIAMDNPDNLQDFVDGFFEASIHGRTNTDFENKSDAWLKGYFEREDIDSEGDIISDDALWSAESTPTEKEFHRDNLSPETKWGDEYQKSQLSGGHDLMGELLLSGRLEEIEGFQKIVNDFNDLSQKAQRMAHSTYSIEDIEGFAPRGMDAAESINYSLKNHQESVQTVKKLVNLIIRMEQIGTDKRTIGRYTHSLLNAASQLVDTKHSIVNKMENLKKTEAYYSNSIANSEKAIESLKDRDLEGYSDLIGYFEKEMIEERKRLARLQTAKESANMFLTESLEDIMSPSGQKKLR